MKEQILQHYQPLLLVFLFIVVGYCIEKYVISQIKKFAQDRKWLSANIIISAIQKMIVLWFTLIGIFLAIIKSPIKPNSYSSIHKSLVVIIIISITYSLMQISGNYMDAYTKKISRKLHSSSIFKNITKLLIFFIGIMVIIQHLGISITPVLTALGVGGLAVALALQDTLSNFFAGIHILASGQVKPGDYIELETGTGGYVTDITWRNTTINMVPNNMIIIPNSKLSSSIITNYDQPEPEMSIFIEVGVSYDCDLEEVELVTLEVGREVMKEVEGGVSSFDPRIRFHTFDDFSINFTVVLRAQEFFNHYMIKHEFVKRLHKRYKEECITIPFPIRTVYMK